MSVITMPAAELSDMLRRAAVFASTDIFELRVLSAVHIVASRGFLIVEATDRYKAIRLKTRLDPKPEPFSIVLPLDAAKATAKMFRTGQVTVTVDKRHMTVTGQASLASKFHAETIVKFELHQGQYPRLASVFARHTKAPAACVTHVDAGHLADVLRGVKGHHHEAVTYWQPEGPDKPIAVRSFDGSRIALLMPMRLTTDPEIRSHVGLLDGWDDACAAIDENQEEEEPK